LNPAIALANKASGASQVGTADLPRLVAFRTLQAVTDDDAYANLALPRLLAEHGLSGRDAALATELGYGTLRASGTLDEILRACSSRQLDDIETGVLNLLRLGAYQLLKTRIPSHAAVATTVDLARATGNGRAAGFVNAVLRKVTVGDYESWCERISRDASPLGQLAVRYAHPGWIVAAFAEVVPEEVEAALVADDERPVTHLVAWPGRISRAELCIQSGGEPAPFSPYAVRLMSGGEPAALPAIKEHQAGVQDEGSQLCALALTRLPVTGSDLRWLDLCAGPGGKAALLAGLAAQSGARLTANELHPHRAELIANATVGWDVEITVGDARRYGLENSPEAGSYDRVLLDAPCTGLGALRRRPEARWRKTAADLADLVRLQRALLDAALRLVRPGGVVGYVTCSPHPAETRQQIEQLLTSRPDVQLVDSRDAFAGVTRLDESPMVQLWPHRHGTDAMFFAGLRRAV
jgi:16S rRNA (cytosine967-C5)-methyltransferase